MLQTRLAFEHEADQISELHVATWKAAYRNLVPGDYLDRLNAASQHDRIARRLAQGSRIKTLVVLKDDKLVGYSSSGPRENDAESIAELYSIYVHPSSWRGGVGKYLLTRTIDLVKSQGFDQLWLSVFEANDAAIKFYRSMGFAIAGDKETFSQENWTLPLVRMVCSLAESNVPNISQ